MMKYVIVACLCLMLVLDQAKSQDQQETTTDKRVERDTDFNQIPQSGPNSNIPGMDQITNMAKAGYDKISEKVSEAMGNIKSRRRRSSEQQ